MMKRVLRRDYEQINSICLWTKRAKSGNIVCALRNVGHKKLDRWPSG